MAEMRLCIDWIFIPGTGRHCIVHTEKLSFGFTTWRLKKHKGQWEGELQGHHINKHNLKCISAVEDMIQ